MDQPTVVEQTSEETKLSRRRLLKVAAATGGAVAASTLIPNKWAKPAVEVGLLPAHAQTSLREAFWTGETQEDCCGPNGGYTGYIMQVEQYLCWDEDSSPIPYQFEWSGGTAGNECINHVGVCNGAQSIMSFAEGKFIPEPGCDLFCDLFCIYFDQREKITLKLYQCPNDMVDFPGDCDLVSSITLSKPD